MPHTFPARNLAEDICLLVLAVGRDEPGDRLADHVCGRVAEDFRRTGIPACDDAVQIFSNDGIVGRFHDGGELRRSLLRPLARGDVDDDTENDRAAGRLNRVETDLHRHLGAILAQCEEIAPLAHRTRLGVAHVTGPIAWMGLAKALRHEHLHRLPDQLLAGVIEEFLGASIREQDATLGVGQQNGGGRSLDDEAKNIVRGASTADLRDQLTIV